jgi:GntR family transcriptional repressor for pyruvate dehydrogenase complex
VRKASDEVLAILADAIRGGLYKPGDTLPRQADLAERLEVSRHVVREAIEVLRLAGVVTVKRGNAGGAQVMSTTNVYGVLTGLGGETHANLRALLEARRPLEITGGELAATRASEIGLKRLGALVEDLERLVDRPDVFLHTDATFHRVMVELSENAILVDFHRRVIDQILKQTSMFPVGRIDPPQAIEHQRRTLDALRTRDVDEVREALDSHLGALELAFLGETLRS